MESFLHCVIFLTKGIGSGDFLCLTHIQHRIINMFYVKRTDLYNEGI